jgi:hypothetical protein
MFTLFGLGIGVSSGYTVVAVFLPTIFPPSFRQEGGALAAYFEADAVTNQAIAALVWATEAPMPHANKAQGVPPVPFVIEPNSDMILYAGLVNEIHTMVLEALVTPPKTKYGAVMMSFQSSTWADIESLRARIMGSRSLSSKVRRRRSRRSWRRARQRRFWRVCSWSFRSRSFPRTTAALRRT